MRMKNKNETIKCVDAMCGGLLMIDEIYTKIQWTEKKMKVVENEATTITETTICIYVKMKAGSGMLSVSENLINRKKYEIFFRM